MAAFKDSQSILDELARVEKQELELKQKSKIRTLAWKLYTRRFQAQGLTAQLHTIETLLGLIPGVNLTELVDFALDMAMVTVTDPNATEPLKAAPLMWDFGEELERKYPDKVEEQ